MKILWLSHLIPYPARSGVAQRSSGLLTELAKRHDVSLMAFHQQGLMNIMSDEPAKDLERAKEHFSRLCTSVEIFDIPWERRSVSRYLLALSSLLTGKSFTARWLESDAFSAALQRLDGAEFDLIHFDTISLAPYRKYFRDAVCVMNHHNIESHLLFRRAKKSESRIERIYYQHEAQRLRAFEKATADQFDAHIVCSALDKQRLLDFVDHVDCEVVPNGVDMSYFHPGEPSEDVSPTFCFLGTLGWGPNRDAAEYLTEEIWPALKAKWPEARMSLVGSNPPPVALARAEKDDSFVATGFVEDERPYIRDASFFLCPIRDGGGTKLKVLNTMSMGKVVVGNPITYEGIDIQHGRNALEATTPDDYVAVVSEMLEAPYRHKSIAAAATQTIAELYSYEVIGRDLARYYSALCNSRSSMAEERKDVRGLAALTSA